MTHQARLLLSMSGPAIDDAVRGLGSLGLLPAPVRLALDFEPVAKPAADWLERALGGTAKQVNASDTEGHTLTWERGTIVTLTRPGTAIARPDTLAQLAALPFELAVIGQLHDEWYDVDYPKVSFGEGHMPHGWASAFQGKGHDRLVSRRWLGSGPWRTTAIGDTTWVEFHDLDADAAAAFAQAQPGWERMGISDTGGFLQRGFLYTDDVRGVYDPTEHKLKVMVPRGDVAPRKLLEIAAARRDPRIHDGQIERTAFVFLREDDARRHLDDLWCYEHEVWAIVDGDPHRLDEDHRVAPVMADWARSSMTDSVPS